MERGRADDCKATKVPQTRQLEKDRRRCVCQGWALPYRSGMRHHLWCLLIYVRFMWLFCGLKNHGLFVRTCQEGLLAGQVRLFPVFVTCSKYVQIYVFPVELSKLADGPVEATSEKLKVKSYFREKFRCSRIMVDGKRKV